MEPNHP